MNFRRLLASGFVSLLMPPSFALECVPAPESAGRKLKLEISAALGRLGPLRAADGSVKVEKTANELVSKLNNPDLAIAEGVMFAAYCSALRDDRTISELEKSKYIADYAVAVREAITDKRRQNNEKCVLDDSEFVQQPYTTENDGRQTKGLTCPSGKSIVAGSAVCMSTTAVTPLRSDLIGTNGMRCQWPPQPIGVGLWVEMICKTAQPSGKCVR
jgi:hypothetical protein